jgi:hypothetical protein
MHSPTVSRRTVVATLALAPMLSVSEINTGKNTKNEELIALGEELNSVTAAIDAAIEEASSPPAVMTTLLERLGHLEAAIVATPARTMEGFFVKARAASWALLGDLDPAGAKTIDQRMALSIIRDLIQLYDPRLERPGALAQLAESD